MHVTLKRSRSEPECNRNRRSPTTCIVIDIQEHSTVANTTIDVENVIEPILMKLPAVTPTTTTRAIVARAIMCTKMKELYCDLVRDGVFTRSNISHECNHSTFLFCSVEDPLGVLAAAYAIIRHLYRGELAAHELKDNSYFNLGRNSRHFMAAALFISYKAKTEDTWLAGNVVPKRVLSRFVTLSDCSHGTSNAAFAKHLTNAEFLILSTLPVHALLDFNVHSVVEVHLGELAARGVIGNNCVFAALSATGLILSRLATLGNVDLLSEVQSVHPMHTVANGLLCASMACVTQSNAIDKHELPNHGALQFCATAMSIAESVLGACKRYGMDGTLLPDHARSVRDLCKSSTVARACSCIEAARRAARGV